MNWTTRHLFVVFGLALCSAFSPILLADSETPESPVGTGLPAPDFALPSLVPGEPPVSLSDHRGRPILLEFWSYWCGPCRSSLPELAALGRAYGRERLAVIAVSVDPDGDGQSLLGTFASDLLAADDRDGAMADRFNVAHLPAAFVIGPDGVVLDMLSGNSASAGALRSRVEEAIRAN